MICVGVCVCVALCKHAHVAMHTWRSGEEGVGSLFQPVGSRNQTHAVRPVVSAVLLVLWPGGDNLTTVTYR